MSPALDSSPFGWFIRVVHFTLAGECGILLCAES